MTAHHPVSRETSGEEHGMVSNYPPGVTGNEPEIAGRPSRSTTRECHADECRYVPLSEVEFWRDRLLQSVEEIRLSLAPDTATEPGDRVEATLRVLQASWEAMRDDEHLFPCLFDGEVEVEVAHGVEFWTCPRCGTDHEDEIEMGPDPDDQRDVERGL